MSHLRHGFQQDISIHALLAESDMDAYDVKVIVFDISIHALLAESDQYMQNKQQLYQAFLSTLSLRRATFAWFCVFLCSFLFLSTLSLRRATAKCYKKSVLFVVKLAILPLPYAIFRDLSKSFQRFIHFKIHFFGAKTPGF